MLNNILRTYGFQFGFAPATLYAITSSTPINEGGITDIIHLKKISPSALEGMEGGSGVGEPYVFLIDETIARHMKQISEIVDRGALENPFDRAQQMTLQRVGIDLLTWMDVDAQLLRRD